MKALPIEDQVLVLGLTGVAALFGAVIGLERERSGKAAGLRTHMLVASASALATGMGGLLVTSAGDPTRVLHGVITGIGFLGSGVIFRDRRDTAGLTSAAVIMLTAMIGATCGLGAPLLAGGVTFFALATLRYVRWVERRFRRRSSDRSLARGEYHPPRALRREVERAFRPNPRPLRR